MIKVFVSGCYDILHGGHIEFFRQAKSLGDYLVVCIASDKVLELYKKKAPSMPLAHKIAILEALEMVDEVVISSDYTIGMDFVTHFKKIRPDILAVTDDDKFSDQKKELCDEMGTRYVQLGKTLSYDPISTTDIINTITTPKISPLRVDIAGGWLDVPSLARAGTFVVNCCIDLFVSLENWEIPLKSGLGGSAAYFRLKGKDPVEEELKMGVGWQDPASILETGLCAWRSGDKPILEYKTNPDFFKYLALYYTNGEHCTPELVSRPRDYNLIVKAGAIAYKGVQERSLGYLCESIKLTHKMQLIEGMDPLPDFGELASRYCGSGWGGYALYVFERENQIPHNMRRVKGYMAPP